MKPLRNWSYRQIALTWLGWLGFLLALEVFVAWKAIEHQRLTKEAERQRTVPAQTDSTHHHLTAVPTQHTEVIFNYVGMAPLSVTNLLVLVGPPGIVTLAWLWTRRRRSDAAPT